MTIPQYVARRLTLPAICAPMFLISSPELVIEACKAGLVGAFPRENTRSRAEFEGWLRQVRAALDAWSARTGHEPGPLAVNIPTRFDDLAAELDLCVRYGVEIIITSVGKPDVITALAHDRGLLVWHDVTSVRFAEKAIEAGVDGLNCIGAGGGGHSGAISHLVLIPKVRSMFDGTISLAGAVATGGAIRAAEVLGADLAFVGSRFAATHESMAHQRQKELMVSGTAVDLGYSAKVNGVPANWMLASLAEHGIDLAALAEPLTRGHDHLPDGVRPWRELWSAGQGIELIDDIPTAKELTARLAVEYLVACRTPDHADAARRLLAEAQNKTAKQMEAGAR